MRSKLGELISRRFPESLLNRRASARTFYELDAAARIAVTQAAMRSRKTLVERWWALGDGESSGWTQRLNQAGALLQGRWSVADLGCGTAGLENILSPDTKYVPVDVVARDARTYVVDFNSQPLPPLGAEAGAALGLIEYIFDLSNFLRQCRAQFEFLVISYNCSDGGESIETRRSHAWVNEYSLDGVETVFSSVGWAIGQRLDLGGGQFLWSLNAASVGEAATDQVWRRRAGA
jgi:SAM-dependent methyltransferase